MQSVLNTVKGTALNVAEYLTPVLKVTQKKTIKNASQNDRKSGWGLLTDYAQSLLFLHPIYYYVDSVELDWMAMSHVIINIFFPS